MRACIMFIKFQYNTVNMSYYKLQSVSHKKPAKLRLMGQKCISSIVSIRMLIISMHCKQFLFRFYRLWAKVYAYDMTQHFHLLISSHLTEHTSHVVLHHLILIFSESVDSSLIYTITPYNMYTHAPSSGSLISYTSNAANRPPNPTVRNYIPHGHP